MSKRNHSRSAAPYAKGYSEAGASVTRRALKGFTPDSGSPNEDINRNNATLRQRSRMLYMASPVATSAINTNRTKVVGTGLTLKATVDRDLLGLSPEAAKEWQHKAEMEFRLWGGKKQNCDALGLNNFMALQQLALKSWLMSGDVFVLVKRYPAAPLNPYSMRLHVIEADRVSTPTNFSGGYTYGGFMDAVVPDGKPGAGHRVFDGVEVDKNGRVVAYYISNTYPHQITTEKQEWTRVPAYGERTGLPNILHIMDSERPDQYRGVPYLAQVIEPLLQLRRYTESELMAALVQSFFTAWIETETDPSGTPFNEVGTGDIAGVPTVSPDGAGASNISDDPNEYEMGPGTVAHLAPGEKVVFGNPNIPTAGFETFVKTICRLVGSALELPYDVLIKEFNSSYSASRGALLEAWEAFKMRRTWLVDRFCQPVYETWLAEAVARGRIKAPGFFQDPAIRKAYSGCAWPGPARTSLNPVQEISAATKRVEAGFSTAQEETAQMTGGNYNRNIRQRVAEAKRKREVDEIMDPSSAASEGGNGNA